jgi:hypothetical protein
MDFSTREYCEDCGRETDHRTHDKGFGISSGLVFSLVTLGLYLPFYIRFILEKRYPVCFECGKLNRKVGS